MEPSTAVEMEDTGATEEGAEGAAETQARVWPAKWPHLSGTIFPLIVIFVVALVYVCVVFIFMPIKYNRERNVTSVNQTDPFRMGDYDEPNWDYNMAPVF